MGGDPIENLSLFETVAEVSVAFAGFAGVVSVFGGSSLHPLVRVGRIRVMIISSLLALLCALAPATVAQFDVSETEMWRISAFILSTATLTRLALVYRWLVPLYTQGLMARTRISLFLHFISAASIATLGMVAGGAFPTLAGALYSCGLLYLLALSCYHFFLLIMSVQPSN